MTPRLAPTPLVLLLACALLAALVGFAYANALDAPFVFDDRPQIVDNPLLLHPEAWFDREAEAAVGATPPQSGALRARFLAVATFALDVRWSGTGPSDFRRTNVLLHLAATLALFAIALRMARAPDLGASPLADSAVPFAFFAAALFGLHPLQTEAVTHVVQRMTSLAALFGLLAVLAHLESRSARSRARRLTTGVGTFLAPAELNLGTIAASRGDLAEAERRFERALELEPDNWIAAVNLGDLRRRAGRRDDAARLYAIAAEAAPQRRTPRERLASLAASEVRRGTFSDASPTLPRPSETDDPADD